MTVTSIADLAPQFANARAYWLGFGVEEQVDGEFAWYRGRADDPRLNGVLRLAAGDPDAALASAGEHLAGRRWLWWVGADSAPGLADALVERGAVLASVMPVMAVDLSRVLEPARPPRLRVDSAHTPAAIQEWAHAYATVFGFRPEQLPLVAEAERRRAERQETFVRLVGRVDGQLVATAALLDLHGVAGIYVISTVVEHRARGIGAAITAAALDVARERGLRVATLQASAAGVPVYRRMGFATVAEYRRFTPPPTTA